MLTALMGLFSNRPCYRLLTETIEWIDNQTAVFVKNKDYDSLLMQLSLNDDSTKSKFVSNQV
jgi:hypothetical protein